MQPHNTPLYGYERAAQGELSMGCIAWVFWALAWFAAAILVCAALPVLVPIIIVVGVIVLLFQIAAELSK